MSEKGVGCLCGSKGGCVCLGFRWSIPSHYVEEGQ